MSTVADSHLFNIYWNLRPKPVATEHPKDIKPPVNGNFRKRPLPDVGADVLEGEHGYWKRLITPRLDHLAELGVPARDTFEKLSARPARIVEPDTKAMEMGWRPKGKLAFGFDQADAWTREIYTLVQPLWSWRDKPKGVIGTVTRDGRVVNTDDDQADRGEQVTQNELAVALSGKFSGIIGAAKEGLYSWPRIEEKARAFLSFLHLDFPKGKTVQTALARLQDVKWWRRKIAEAIPRIVDQVTRKYELVGKEDHQEIYCSDAAFRLFLSRQQASRDLMEDMLAVNDHGQEFSLADLQDRSISNPKCRRTELMVRLRGCEEYAQDLGWSARFITLTCPSKYHRFKGKGTPNDDWNFSTPRECNDYLERVFSRIRSRLRYRGIQYYGCRVVEPHHDGCPHWHFLLFAPPSRLDEIAYLFRKYGLAEDGRELGALEHRVDIEPIMPSKGSATGYIAKYVAKSIDGFGIDETRVNLGGGGA